MLQFALSISIYFVLSTYDSHCLTNGLRNASSNFPVSETFPYLYTRIWNQCEGYAPLQFSGEYRSIPFDIADRLQKYFPGNRFYLPLFGYKLTKYLSSLILITDLEQARVNAYFWDPAYDDIGSLSRFLKHQKNRNKLEAIEKLIVISELISIAQNSKYFGFQENGNWIILSIGFHIRGNAKMWIKAKIGNKSKIKRILIVKEDF